MLRFILLFFILITSHSASTAMDYGLRFASHSTPVDSRTSLRLGNVPFRFSEELLLGFHFSFYKQPFFGNIATITTDNGKTLSIVSSYQGHQYQLGLVIDGQLELLGGSLCDALGQECKIDFKLNRKRNAATLICNERELEKTVDLADARSASIVFGLASDRRVSDVAPMDIRNIRIFINDKNTNHWDLKFHHTSNTCLDELAGLAATAENPQWLIDDHTDWHLIFQKQFKERVQTAFDPKTEQFYIVSGNKIRTLRPSTGETAEFAVKGGFRPMSFSNHIMFDSVSNRLLNYNLSRQRSAWLDLRNPIWTSGGDIPADDEPNFANHTVASDGKNAYFFGGYGFYRFHNELFKLDLSTGKIEPCRLTPQIQPRTSASSALIGDTLYIFGGLGNDRGIQELPTRYNYTLYAYSIITWQGRVVWQADSVETDFLPTQSMFYDSNDDCFYAGSTANGGELIKISRSRPEIKRLTTSINSKMDFYDMVFDLYRSDDGKRYYLLMDKRLDKHTHDYSIYTVAAPFIDNPEIIDHKHQAKSTSTPTDFIERNWLPIVGIIILLAAVPGGFILLSRKRRKSSGDRLDSEIRDMQQLNHSEREPTWTSASDMESESSGISSAITLLGTFSIRDLSGSDITTKFSDRLKSLFIYLLLNCSNNSEGVPYQAIDETIWGDKDEKSAHNNRNVYMRKLRLLLESVGDMSITYYNGYFKISCGNVECDYTEAIKLMNESEANESTPSSVADKMLELLAKGPLLPSFSHNWIDAFKAEYTDKALEWLTRSLFLELSRNEERAFLIAKIIFLHEPLSEDAMKVMCIIMSKRKRISHAKAIYDKFCREYRQNMGEEFTVPFSDICKH